ncbi:MAG: hypothetical protein K6L75_16155 [Cellvibrionaceae bacterium]
MSVVKGTKSPRLMVVPYQPYFKVVAIVSVIAAVLIAGTLSFIAGKEIGAGVGRDAIAERDELRESYREKIKEAEDLSQQVANLSLASEVDKTSNEEVRSQIIQQKEKIAALEEDITFYRGLMSPTDNKQGLAIGSVNVLSTGVSRQFDFKIVIQQLVTNHQLLNGTLNVNVIGREAGTPRILPLKDLTTQVDTTDIKLRFKYFQDIKGRLELPIGFEAERIEVIAKSSGKNSSVVEKKFGWLVEEN